MKYIKVFTDFRELMAPLNDEERGRLFEAMLAYGADGVQPLLQGSERILWPVARQIIDREAEAYEEKVASVQRARDAKRRHETGMGSAKNSMISGEDKEKEKEKDKEQE